ncbi:putative fungal specific transcription [Phaeomoniella chlamydospora]|uniref:Putative fungal specific transcription n=1 Tax=Phaeomoniella chlamydospora TaxID=158046 RepID=A0A0G2ET57_PHACM|nr:putative fungal specific transcription [Phaeomoniella chlamydospora]
MISGKEKGWPEHKRCTHVFGSTLGSASADGDETLFSPNDTSSPDTRPERRFISDLVPESYLVAETESPNNGGRLSHVGVFIEENSTGRSYDDIRRIGSPDTNIQKSGNAIHTRRKLNRYLEAVGAFRVLPNSTHGPLVNIYISLVQPLLPILDLEEFHGVKSNTTASRLLINAICLVACKAEGAAGFLRLEDGGPLLSGRDFASEIYQGLVAAINARLESSRLDETRILALMSMHSEGIRGVEDASLHLTHAVHHATTDAMHIHYAGRSNVNDSRAALFWSLWTMDKINCSMAGRPLIIRDDDIGIGRSDKTGTNTRRAFDVWYDLSAMLAKAIGFYRPNAEGTGWEDDYPSFEAVVGKDLEDRIGESTFALLELYYQAITILACREDNSATASYSRQALAALRIQALLTVELVSELAPLPIVPYAASLALSVAYRHLRKAEIPSRVRTSIANLRICTEILERYAKVWWCATAMAKLGRKVLDRYQEGHFPKTYRHPKTTSGITSSTAPGTTSINFQKPRNSLDILSTAAAAHGKNRPDGDDPAGDGGLVGHDANTGPSNNLQLSTDETQLLPENFFQDFDTLFGDYLDPSQPLNYLDMGIFDNNDTLNFPII